MNKNEIKINNIDEIERNGYTIKEDENRLQNRIREKLKEKGLSQIELAKRTGISKQNISDIINNKFKPGIDFVLKIATVLEVSVEELFQLEENEWKKIVKSSEGLTMYVDLYKLIIIDNKKRKEKINENGLDYYLLTEKRCVNKEYYNKILKEYIKANNNKDKLKKEIIKEFEQTICCNRYKKLYKKIVKK